MNDAAPNGLDGALRTMLRERAGDIDTVPATLAAVIRAGSSDGPGNVVALDHLRTTHAHHKQPSRWLLVAAVAAVLAVVGSLVIVQRFVDNRTTQPAGPSRPTSAPTAGPTTVPTRSPAGLLRWSFQLDLPQDYRLHDRALTEHSQTVILARTGDPDAVGCCGNEPRTDYVIVYSAGEFDPTAALHGSPVTVGRHSGYLATLPPGPFDAISKVSDHALPTLAWEYARGAWAMVQATTPTTQRPEELLRVANAVRIGAWSHIPVPLGLNFLPPGMVAQQATRNETETYGTTVIFGDGPVTSEATTQLRIQIWSEKGPHQKSSNLTTPVAVGGRPGTLFSDGTVEVPLGTRSVTFDFFGPFASRAELMKILSAVYWAPVTDDPRSWFDAVTMVAV